MAVRLNKRQHMLYGLRLPAAGFTHRSSSSSSSSRQLAAQPWAAAGSSCAWRRAVAWRCSCVRCTVLLLVRTKLLVPRKLHIYSLVSIFFITYTFGLSGLDGAASGGRHRRLSDEPRFHGAHHEVALPLTPNVN
jgi:hypothetical protein